MPSTFELVQMREADWLDQYGADFKVGPVLLPAGYRDDPLLWGVLGHEVGGHYVLTAEKYVNRNLTVKAGPGRKKDAIKDTLGQIRIFGAKGGQTEQSAVVPEELLEELETSTVVLD